MPKSELVDEDPPICSNALDAHVCALRRKLGAGWVATVIGVGFRLLP